MRIFTITPSRSSLIVWLETTALPIATIPPSTSSIITSSPGLRLGEHERRSLAVGLRPFRIFSTADFLTITLGASSPSIFLSLSAPSKLRAKRLSG
ncbi:MAG: hypothetical protein DRN59_02995 [Thaumarchaeota archaeon]|nr:MAG: hypothetical protein DRN59_02995 [Nitrososphaerota archaeon]